MNNWLKAIGVVLMIFSGMAALAAFYFAVSILIHPLAVPAIVVPIGLAVMIWDIKRGFDYDEDVYCR